ncbi:hypothetical protein DRW07_07895 [Alteromonas sediminis]|uniref:Uncharacterized protein n=1 Tax=Alteromonas sediminis TaxID=2259342 RepID=A0A3N5Z921_9ALTE|nr:hypothetical protein [Alteromonas sediminis]RPJ67434.1 hypothetical protein DRW07_07895 [Alteromonas sediminis]
MNIKHNLIKVDVKARNGILKRLYEDVKTPALSAIESTEKLTANVLIASVQTFDLGVTSLNVIAESIESTARHSVEQMKRIDVDSVFKSLTKDKEKETD